MAVRLARILRLHRGSGSLSFHLLLLPLLQPLRLLIVSHLHLLTLLRLALLELLSAIVASPLLDEPLLLFRLLLFHPLSFLALFLLLLGLLLLHFLALPILLLLRFLHFSLLPCIHRRIHAVVFSGLSRQRAIRTSAVREPAV